MLKKLFKIIVPIVVVLIASPFVLYGAIVLTNNSIADKVEKQLIAYNMPDNTVFVDSVSAAGKLVGNGNGMQYMGSILVESDLNEQELKEHYGKDFDYVEVRKQENANIDFLNSDKYSFNGFSAVEGKSYYSITCWGSDSSYGGFISVLLDLDLRGF